VSLQVDAHVLLLTVITFNYVSFPYGIATAATIRVGNLLGAGDSARARLAAWLAVALGAGSMAICAAVMFATRSHLAAVFIRDDEVSSLVSQLALIACSMEVLDGVMGTAQGALRGAGWQGSLMWYNLIGFWVVGVSSGAMLTFAAGLGLPGLWIGMMLGIGTTGALNIRALLGLDWAREATKAVAAAKGAAVSSRGDVATGVPMVGESVGLQNGMERSVVACAGTDWPGEVQASVTQGGTEGTALTAAGSWRGKITHVDKTGPRIALP
jgi:hypothetical protein